IKACGERGKPVTLCGEMAGRLRCFLPLLGMGLRRFSMSPAFLPPLKDLVRRISRPMAQALTARVLKMKTTRELRDYLTWEVQKIWPEATLLDTGAQWSVTRKTAGPVQRAPARRVELIPCYNKPDARVPSDKETSNESRT